MVMESDPAAAQRKRFASSAVPRSPRQAVSNAPFALSGCRPVPVSRAEIADHDYPYEYWDADSELAWEVHENSLHHEEPSGRLVELVKDIAKLRGTPITVFGAADLQERDASGARVRIAQADQLVYLDRPDHLPETVVVIGKSPLPDVVLEVDLTTDVHERKLDLYAGWGIPELWVEVPDARMPSKRKAPGLTIHILDDCRYRQAAESDAFPTWTAREIHSALNEPSSSAITIGTLRRVGEVMGRQSGTGPEDDPLLGAERRLSRLAGFSEGRIEGRDVGRHTGLLEERLSTLEGLLAMRNIPVAGQLRDEAKQIAALPREAVLHAALACSDLADFLRRLDIDGVARD